MDALELAKLIEKQLSYAEVDEHWFNVAQRPEVLLQGGAELTVFDDDGVEHRIPVL